MLDNLLIGFKEESILIDRIISKGNLPHAILLSGLKSIGKRRFARSIASKIFLHHSSEKSAQSLNDPNEKIVNQVFRGTYPDLYIVEEEEGKSNISVDQIREVIQNYNLKPYYDQGAVIIINDAHKMTISAANALLKALEEPEENKYFILLTHQEHLIPDTINSRTQTFNCHKRTKEEIQEIINLLSPSESIKIPRKLIEHLNGSLSLLNLSHGIDSKTLLPKSESSLVETIKSKVIELEDYVKRINDLLSIESRLNLKSQLIQFFRSSEKDTEIVNIKINIFAHSLREQMKSESHWDLEILANTILELSHAQSEIQIRHLDPEIRIANTIS